MRYFNSSEKTCLTQVFTGAAWSSFLLDSVCCAKSNALNQHYQVLGRLRNFNSASFHVWFIWLCDHLLLYLLHRSITFYHSCSLCGLLLVSNECQPAKSVFTDFSLVFQNTCEVVEKQCSPSENRYLRYKELMPLEPRRNALTLLQRRVILTYVFRVWFFGFCVWSSILCNERWLGELQSWSSSWKITAYMVLFPYRNKSNPERYLALNQSFRKEKAFVCWLGRKLKNC